MNTIDNTQDVIDSRDIIERVAELEQAVDGKFADNNEIDELETLTHIIDQADGYGEFEYGETLIHKSYFAEYCRELCEDVGDIPSGLPWYIENHIDWDGVAREIKQDYTEIDFDGVSYFMRA